MNVHCQLGSLLVLSAVLTGAGCESLTGPSVANIEGVWLGPYQGGCSAVPFGREGGCLFWLGKGDIEVWLEQEGTVVRGWVERAPHWRDQRIAFTASLEGNMLRLADPPPAGISYVAVTRWAMHVSGPTMTGELQIVDSAQLSNFPAGVAQVVTWNFRASLVSFTR